MADGLLSMLSCQLERVLPVLHCDGDIQVNSALIGGKPDADRVFGLNEQVQISPDKRLDHVHRKVWLVNVSRSITKDGNGVKAFPGEVAGVKIESRAGGLKIQVPDSSRGNGNIQVARQISFAPTHIVPSLGLILLLECQRNVQCENHTGNP